MRARRSRRNGLVDNRQASQALIADPLARFIEWLAVGLGLLFALTALESEAHASLAAESFGLLLAGVAGLMLVAQLGSSTAAG